MNFNFCEIITPEKNAEMDKYKLKTQKLQQIFHFDEHNIEKICTSLENGMHFYFYYISNKGR